MKLSADIFRILGALLAIAVFGFFTLQLIAGDVAVISITLGLWKKSLIVWADMEGWKKYYFLCGALTVGILSIIFFIKAVLYIFKKGISVLFINPFYIIFGIAAFAAVPLLLFPLITVGWPIIVFWFLKLYWNNSKAVNPTAV
jgi:hypothetical protein